MKLCSSLIVSAMFHAAALFLPLSGVEPRPQELISVVVMGIAEGEEGHGGSADGTEPQGSGTRQQRAVQKARAKDETAGPDGQGVDTWIAAAREKFENESPVEPTSDVGITVAEVNTKDAGESRVSSASAGGRVAGSEFSAGGAGTGGNESGIGAGRSGNGLGLAGDGNGGGGLGATPAYAGVSYAHTPKPAYPEEARKGGWEGTVILGVLVNVGGKAEKIEIKGSSGYAPLDQAAVEGLKRWLFRPARYGERAVESWVKIPVVFQLAEVKD